MIERESNASARSPDGAQVPERIVLRRHDRDRRERHEQHPDARPKLILRRRSRKTHAFERRSIVSPPAFADDTARLFGNPRRSSATRLATLKLSVIGKLADNAFIVSTTVDGRSAIALAGLVFIAAAVSCNRPQHRP